MQDFILFPAPGMEPVSPMSSVAEAQALATGLQRNSLFWGGGNIDNIVILILLNKILNKIQS